MPDRYAVRLAIAITSMTAGVIGLTGCSSSGPAPAQSVPPSHASTSIPSEPTTATTKSAPAASGKTLSAEEACKVISTNIGVISRIAAAGGDPKIDISIAKLRALQNTAPAAIRSDIKVIADFDQAIVDAIRAGKSPDSIAETPALDSALRHEVEWTAENCVPSN